MSTFANRMIEAKRAKAEARARGDQAGDFRGTVSPRPLPEAPADWLEMCFARIALGLAHDRAEEKARLDWLLLENADPTIAAYAEARDMPW